ncbi:putative cDENN domain, tripartite DENN domain, DENN domain lobe protein [Helianthus anomalus]
MMLRSRKTWFPVSSDQGIVAYYCLGEIELTKVVEKAFARGLLDLVNMELFITGNGKVQMSRSNELKAVVLLANHLRESILYDRIMHFFCKPLWDAITYTLSNVPLPAPGKERVLFGIENTLLSVDFPPKDGLPHAVHVYIPLLFFSGVDYIDAPTPYMMGLHSSVDIAGLSMDGVVVVDLETNCITTSKEIPAIPEPEMSSLRNEILKLLHPNVVWIDSMKADPQSHQL